MKDSLKFDTSAQAYHAGWINALTQALEDIDDEG